MSQINNFTDTLNRLLYLQKLAGEEGVEQKSGNQNTTSLPNENGNTTTTPGSSGTNLPVLEKPLAAGSSLPLELLLQALGENIRKSETNAGLSSIKANAAAQEEANNKKLEKIKEQLEKLESAGIWDKISKAFAWIGAIAGVVIAGALVATGGGAAAGVGLALACVALVNQIGDTVGEAVDGKGYGLTSLIGRGIADAAGDAEAAGWIKMGLDIALTIATIACSFGAGAGKLSDATKAVQVAHKVGQAAQATSGVVQGASGIASGVYKYQASSAQAEQKRFEAILEEISMMNELINTHLKHVIEEGQKLNESVSDIVNENAKTQAAIMTENANFV